jgi:hypothetical protein
MIATDYGHTVHPETGEDVVFIPGEALPDWVVAVADVTPPATQQPEYDDLTVADLRKLAGERGIETAGLKSEIVEALEHFDRIHINVA